MKKLQPKVYTDVLTQLQSPTPQQVTITFNSRFSAKQEAEIRNYIQLTVGMSKQQSSGAPIKINVEPTASKKIAGKYDPLFKRLYVHKDTDVSTILHETVHAMQHQLQYGVAASNAHGDAATSGRQATTEPGYKTYTGITDNAYAYRVYPSGAAAIVGRWSELLTTGLDSIVQWSSWKDRSLIELTTQIIKDNSK